ncbi:hypothetical protein BB559_003196 [Furculomyces boomerangus]|uniref:Peptidase A1 domain-containing protein n=2 Tax=Harpellales TaxID=61421 RepID=A0A2T9YMY7_9FUNG|nr:hypothetical protein BB559_003196 [Furculomyces boomerangus]PVZ99034.1 hypothetical protein BB558_004958 [Smittium angustum]
MSDTIFSEEDRCPSKVITVPLHKHGHEVYINIGIGNPVQTVKAKLDFQTHYSLIVDKKSNLFGKEAAFNGGYSTNSDSSFNNKLNAYQENDQTSKVLGLYGQSNFEIGNKLARKYFLNMIYRYHSDPKYYPWVWQLYIDSNGSGVLKSFGFGYQNYVKYESNGFTNGFLGLEPRFKDTTPNGFFSSETSIMDFLGPDKMITIDMRNGKSSFSLGNTICANETINWMKSENNDSFEFKIEDIIVKGKKIDDNTDNKIRNRNITAVFNPRYRDIYIEKTFADKINNPSFQVKPGCNMDFGSVLFHSNNIKIGLKPESFLRSGLVFCYSDVKTIDSSYPPNKWIFGWSFNKGRAIVYDYERSRVGIVDEESIKPK